MIQNNADRYVTFYETRRGQSYDAYFIEWHDVEDILGHTFDDDEEDNYLLARFLLSQGAPPWVMSADEGWADKFGWGLIGPEREEGR